VTEAGGRATQGCSAAARSEETPRNPKEAPAQRCEFRLAPYGSVHLAWGHGFPAHPAANHAFIPHAQAVTLDRIGRGRSNCATSIPTPKAGKQGCSRGFGRLMTEVTPGICATYQKSTAEHRINKYA
jgi:hypothetical protein